MKNKNSTTPRHARWGHIARMLCACAAICAWGTPARADQAGDALLKSARWQALTPSRSTALAVVPGARGPIIAVSANDTTAFDRTTGKTLWSAQARGTLVGVGEKAVLILQDKKLTGLSTADGSQSYEISFPNEFAFHAAYDTHLIGKVLIVQSNQRYTFAGPGNPPRGVPRTGGGPPVLAAYDVETGKQLWQNDAAENMGVSFTYSPLIELWTGANHRMLDPVTGKVQWTYTPDNNSGKDTIRSNDGTWFSLERMLDASPNTYKLVMRNETTGKVIGDTNLENVTGQPAAATPQMIVMRDARQSGSVRAGIDVMRTVDLTEDQKKDKYTAYDTKTGKVIWNAAVTVDNTNTRLRVLGDVLLAGDSKAEPTLQPHGFSGVTALDAATGKQLWAERIYSDIAVQKDLLVFAAIDQWVGVNRRDGKHLWSIPCDAFSQGGRAVYIPCDPIISEGTLYLAITHTGDPMTGNLFAIPLEGNAAAIGKP